MTEYTRFTGKREVLSQALLASGVTSLINRLPQRDLLLVLNYHRVANPDEDPFDPDIISATADELDQQIAYMKRHVSLVTLEEALDFVSGRRSGDKSPRCRALITFDDGYLDNYQRAFPVLRSHGVQGVFFLVTNIVGSCHIPWWDHSAYLVKTARNRKFTLRYPFALDVDLDQNGLTRTLRYVVELIYRNSEDTDTDRFLRELKEASNGEDPPTDVRRFLDWNEAREMLAGDMAIGSHTHLHCILSQLEPERQREELEQSRAILKQQLDIQADSLAYPIGARTSFSEQTQQIAQQAGYRAAFSFHGGTNSRGKTNPYDVKRVPVGGQSWSRFRVQISNSRFVGRYWP